ncbi:MAG: hypothetical protein WC307_07130 [Candidatus Nanoarchaeia archaeon]|jgi:hypothetical protein
MKIFLAGEVRSNWRDELIKEFKEHSFYNPKVKNYSAADKQAERTALKDYDFVIFLLQGHGKGTTAEMKLCEKIDKPHGKFKSVGDIKIFLNRLRLEGVNQ